MSITLLVNAQKPKTLHISGIAPKPCPVDFDGDLWVRADSLSGGNAIVAANMVAVWLANDLRRYFKNVTVVAADTKMVEGIAP